MNSETTRYFINIIENNPMLWQKSHRDYKDAVKKTMAWMSVGSLLSPPLDGPTAASRYKSLRDRFVRFSKIEDEFLMTNPTEEYTCSWPFYDALKFLKPEIRARNTVSNLLKRRIDENCEINSADSHIASEPTHSGKIRIDSAFQLKPTFKVLKPSESNSGYLTTEQMKLFMEKLNGSPTVLSDDSASYTDRTTQKVKQNLEQGSGVDNESSNGAFNVEIETDPLDLGDIETEFLNQKDSHNQSTKKSDSAFLEKILRKIDC